MLEPVTNQFPSSYVPGSFAMQTIFEFRKMMLKKIVCIRLLYAADFSKMSVFFQPLYLFLLKYVFEEISENDVPSEINNMSGRRNNIVSCLCLGLCRNFC